MEGTVHSTMHSEITTLIRNTKVFEIEMVVKVKTKDGSKYTIQRDTFKPERAVDFGETVYQETVKNLLEITNRIEQGKGFVWAEDDMACILKSDIVKVWAAIGSVGVDAMPETK